MIFEWLRGGGRRIQEMDSAYLENPGMNVKNVGIGTIENLSLAAPERLRREGKA